MNMLPNLKNIGGLADENDIAHVLNLGHKPVAVRPCPVIEGKINPHVTTFLLEDGQFLSVFHVKPIYYEALDGSWRPMNEVATHHGNRKISLSPHWMEKMSVRYFSWLQKRQALIRGGRLSIDYGLAGAGLQPSHLAFALTLTVYPDPSVETTTVDGFIGLGTQASWATCHDAAAGDDTSDSSTDLILVADAGGSTYRIYRSAALFDTSSLTSSASISATVLSLWFRQVNNGQTTSAGIVQANPASNTALVTADYDVIVGTVDSDTVTASIAYASLNVDTAYNDFTFDATGRGWVSKTGVSKFGIRCATDYAETSSHASAPSAAQSDTRIRSADTAATTNDPKLVVTYTLVESSGKNFLMFM